MKKIILSVIGPIPKNAGLLLIFAAGIIISYAQPITISQWDVAGVGTVLHLATDTVKTQNPGFINPGPAGENQTWNFSTLMSNTVDTLTFTNPNWLPNGSNFPNANLAIINSSDTSEIYLENISTGLFINGVYADPLGQGAILIKFNPTEQLAAFTAAYDSAFQNTSVVDIIIAYSPFPGVDSVRFKETKNKDVKTDGWGNIITPLGTYNCLRNRGEVITIDSIWLHNASPPGWFPAPSPYSPVVDIAWHFSWWGNGKGFPLLEFDSTAGDTIKNISWLKTLPVPGGINETSSFSGVSVYPNPSNGQFQIQLAPGNWQLTKQREPSIAIYNVMGEKVFELSTLIPKDFRTQPSSLVDISSQPDGIYLLHIASNEGTVTHKLIIKK